MDEIVKILEMKGIIITIGLVIFIYVFKYSRNIFDWIERQTLGTRTYIMERLDLLFIEIPEDRITFWLLSLSLGLSGFAFLVFSLFGKWIIGFFIAILLSFIGFKIPKPFVDMLVEKRRKEYQDQMVDGLQLLANGLRAGLSVPQALGMVVDEMRPPLTQEFNLILQQNKIGVPLEECFDNLVKRVPIEDNEMFVSSVNILRETGGNLAEVFDTIVDVIRERVRLQQKIDTFTAQGRFQGMAISLMPFLVGGVYFASDPDSIIRLFTSAIGILLTVFAFVLDFVGFIIILKIVKIKI